MSAAIPVNKSEDSDEISDADIERMREALFSVPTVDKEKATQLINLFKKFENGVSSAEQVDGVVSEAYICPQYHIHECIFSSD